MNIYEKIDILCERIKILHERLMHAHELCNETGISHDLQLERYLEIERIEKTIEILNNMKKDLFIEAGISLD
jgi:hypothetical protein